MAVVLGHDHSAHTFFFAFNNRKNDPRAYWSTMDHTSHSTPDHARPYSILNVIPTLEGNIGEVPLQASSRLTADLETEIPTTSVTDGDRAGVTAVAQTSALDASINAGQPATSLDAGVQDVRHGPEVNVVAASARPSRKRRSDDNHQRRPPPVASRMDEDRAVKAMPGKKLV
ncbi:hypothetical protein L226DRAFT_521499 [Lentinus tigrinus ALCF2SS1-7]|uniref:Uncharacterized protein n=1 Tax=Lentinus tigrinus ALCF2SS1-6 TaxID=1328759 RepID=A0A5C2SEL0_9APHY|nr:hypothetical protein L227DRAFT_562132 [Lentinus tigrinus ALCF2SS1-6]RPD78045.1 hypothetical protein L226DRAFT_521499 [Lentinus tigrinus ALCF2SS1-7]